MKTVSAKMAGVGMILALFFTGCGGGGGGSGDSETSSSGSGVSFITCTSPYQKCAEIDSSDMRNIRFTFPQLKVRIQPALGTGYFFYEIAGSNVEQGLVFTEYDKPVTQDGLTVEYARLPGAAIDLPVANSPPAFKLTWKGEEIFVIALGLPQFLVQGLAHFALLVTDNFEASTGAEGGGQPGPDTVIINGFGSSFESYGEQINWHDAICNSVVGDCNQPNILVKWIADSNFLIDY